MAKYLKNNIVIWSHWLLWFLEPLNVWRGMASKLKFTSRKIIQSHLKPAISFVLFRRGTLLQLKLTAQSMTSCIFVQNAFEDITFWPKLPNWGDLNRGHSHDWLYRLGHNHCQNLEIVFRNAIDLFSTRIRKTAKISKSIYIFIIYYRKFQNLSFFKQHFCSHTFFNIKWLPRFWFVIFK